MHTLTRKQLVFGAVLLIAAAITLLLVLPLDPMRTTPRTSTSTTPLGELVLFYPNGGEEFSIGETITLQWDGIKYTHEAGTSVSLVDEQGKERAVASLSPTVRDYQWKINKFRSGDSITPGIYKIKLVHYVGLCTAEMRCPRMEDYSDDWFTIKSGLGVKIGRLEGRILSRDIGIPQILFYKKTLLPEKSKKYGIISGATFEISLEAGEYELLTTKYKHITDVVIRDGKTTTVKVEI